MSPRTTAASCDVAALPSAHGGIAHAGNASSAELAGPVDPGRPTISAVERHRASAAAAAHAGPAVAAERILLRVPSRATPPPRKNKNSPAKNKNKNQDWLMESPRAASLQTASPRATGMKRKGSGLDGTSGQGKAARTDDDRNSKRSKVRAAPVPPARARCGRPRGMVCETGAAQTCVPVAQQGCRRAYACACDVLDVRLLFDVENACCVLIPWCFQPLQRRRRILSCELKRMCAAQVEEMLVKALAITDTGDDPADQQLVRRRARGVSATLLARLTPHRSARMQHAPVFGASHLTTCAVSSRRVRSSRLLELSAD